MGNAVKTGVSVVPFFGIGCFLTLLVVEKKFLDQQH